VALNTFERLAELLFAPGDELFDRILFLPGNHDHHAWEMGRETHYRRAVAAHHSEHGDLPAPDHVTGLDPRDAVPSLLLETVVGHVDQAHGVGESAASGDPANPATSANPETSATPANPVTSATSANPANPAEAPTRERPDHGVEMLYPNMALVDRELDRAIVLHHGHYVEPLYHFFSRLRRVFFPDRPPPRTVAEIEAENFSWIDFVWSLLGRSGGAGEDVERVFDMLLYPDRTRTLLRGVAERAAPVLRMPFLPTAWLREFVLERVLLRIAERATTERTRLHVVCSERTMEGAKAYLFGPTFRQIEDELGAIPSELTFIFGHTHKPFERSLTERPGESGARTVDVVNTGGWVIDTLEPDPAFGAAILVVSRALEAASIRVFNDGPDEESYRASVRSAPSRPESTPFTTRRREVVGPAGARAPDARDAPGGRREGDPWLTLADALLHEVERRRAHHRRRREAGV